MLTDGQIRAYRDHGYLVVENVFGDDEIAELNRVTDSFVERGRNVRTSNDMFDVTSSDGGTTPVVRRIKNPTLLHDAYESARRQKALLDIVECLIGPGVRFDHCKLNFKPVGGGGAIDWHQDWAFYPHTNDDLLAVGVYLEDCGPENGPLMVVPGSHKGPILDHHAGGKFVGSCRAEDLGSRRDTAVPLTGRAGAITIHHVRTLHGSLENRGARERRLLLLCYRAIDAWPLVGPVDLEAFDSAILRGSPTLAPRQIAVPVRLPMPKAPGTDSIYEDQAPVAGRSFAQAG